ncbi:MAG TPA: alpha/beta hydrolase family protein [Acidimicrobiales bacterium]|nr:alpha/beta hydrolase family protein [Acidimicrobiales bacterium]
MPADPPLVLPAPDRNYSPWYSWMVRLGQTRHIDPLPLPDPGGAEGAGDAGGAGRTGDASSSEYAAALAEWRVRCRQRLVTLLGPMPSRAPLRLETIESVECEDYRRDKVVFDTEQTMSVPAYLLVPHGRVAPGPAVLAAHGHGPGKAEAVGLERTGTPNADYAHQLARRGYVVLAPDLRCFGERLDWNPDDHYACDTNLVHAVMAGINPLTQNLWDLGRALDVLETHPLVDPGRMAMVGLSYGGTVTLFLAAWDARVAAAVVSGYFSSWAEAHKMPWNMCGSQVLPGMLGQLEHVDLGALISPRPLLVESGTHDDLFPAEVAAAEIAKLRAVYASDGVPERLVHDVFEGVHEWHGVEAFAFLERWIGPGDAAVSR